MQVLFITELRRAVDLSAELLWCSSAHSPKPIVWGQCELQLHTLLQTFPALLQKCYALPVPVMLCPVLVHRLSGNSNPIKAPIKVKNSFTPEQAGMGKDCILRRNSLLHRAVSSGICLTISRIISSPSLSYVLSSIQDRGSCGNSTTCSISSKRILNLKII